MINLATLDTEQASDAGVEIQLKHPVTGAPLEAWITIYGRDGRRYEDKQIELQRRRLELMAAGRAVDDDAVRRTAQDAIELVAAMTKGWRELQLGDTPAAFSEAEALKLYSRRGLRWIRDQVDEAIHTRALFMPGGATD